MNVKHFVRGLVGLVAALCAALSFAAVDVNKAAQADLETIKGIGPGLSGKILVERKKNPFKDWSDLIERVGGVGAGNAAKFSSAGLTVNGALFSGAAPAKVTDSPKKTKGDKPAVADGSEAKAAKK
ncbi:MAG: helix-hairpin-helix domain-containing protein [Burkholderiales bacterium]